MILLAAMALAAAAALPAATGPIPTAAPPPAFGTLDGSSPAQVKMRLGEPAVAHAEGAGAMWTYRLSRCALFVYFSDAGTGLKVSGTETGPRRHGETPPDAAACLAAAPAPVAPTAHPASATPAG